ncbi:(deoxy)nucleoside triphosphate pyrophosphohydrolase [Ruania suaedae]|uniref:(deoxy)nucleoside triphosphate pyrophosphohydrolase n=1 Tax=Ruania suaedae TaxID=2897774 RepID=UPI001E40B2B8|nr:(deoxy)nucleoside triphosphate pyrophosphohydrolase [Ruania suaedae]UFU02806.1 (deoxy)nucleoside triphosphate pyrophosphohydrolase [Ruania suaedae]
MPARSHLVVAAAVVDDLDRPTMLLAARRSAPKSLAGRWEFAGGKVEEGEDEVTALRRELREELGVAVEVGAAVPGPEHGGWPILHGHTMRIWFARITAGTPEPLADHDDLRWLPMADLLAVDWLEPDLPVVHAVRAAASTGPVA